MGGKDEFDYGGRYPAQRNLSSSGVVDRLSQLERARCKLVADQYEAAIELREQRVAERRARGGRNERWEAGLAGELGLALRISPHRAARFLNCARELAHHLPELRCRLHDGDVSPEAVPIIVAGLSHLEPADRLAADRALCSDPQTIAGLGVRRLQNLVQRIAYERDRQGTVDRIAKAAKDRRVTIRPEPDAMARVSIVLPVTQAVAIYAALRRATESIAGTAHEVRTRSQIMADEAFRLLTGRDGAQAVPVAVNLTMPAGVLLGERAGTVHVGGGPAIPAEIARVITARAVAAGQAWVRRLFIEPKTGSVVAMDSRARCFPTGLADVIAARDQYCRTPYCDAPIAHTDHVVPHHAGGATSFDNGQGLCAACNYTKEAAGWSSATVAGESGRHTVRITTPSGHVYRSTAPAHVA